MRADDDLELFLRDLVDLCNLYKFSVIVKIQEVETENVKMAGFYVFDGDNTILLPAYIKSGDEDEKAV